ncbi:GNAT family N-acetyltransferase [Halorientalis brevis]|uniref:GNAT family N-acetyltransferase n=1 Tax=Halorientalis brevis TaxID=1126241 RepID=A0ABD6CDP4_9EURY|nr:GNAT family N-acetyltransferase [Halorientalis brevis]
MEVQSAASTDAEEIATVARASLSESYGHFIDEDAIVDIVEEWYSAPQLSSLLDDENEVFLLAYEDDDLVGFVQGALLQEDPPAGELDWLHVSPHFRGEHTGTQLLGQFQDRIEDQGAEVLRGKVLAQNEDGGAFYEEHGFDHVATREVTIGETNYDEQIYEKPLGGYPAEEVVETITEPNDRELFVSFSDAERGAKGPFYTVFSSEALEERYGFYCGNCESVDTAMDAMGRIECNNCGNKRKATRWDASYL